MISTLMHASLKEVYMNSRSFLTLYGLGPERYFLGHHFLFFINLIFPSIDYVVNFNLFVLRPVHKRKYEFI